MRKLPIAAILAALAMPAAADDFTPMLQDFLDSEVRSWANNPILINAVRTQNTQRAGMTIAQIEELDRAWRSEIGATDTPTITPVLENSASDYLRERMEETAGIITEVIVMDAHGLNVAASGLTSDMWQGDEAKFNETYPKGPDAVHFGDVEFDESSQIFQGQISIPLVDDSTGEIVGAMTVGVNAEALM